MIASTFRGEAGQSVKLEFDPGGLRCSMQFYLQEKESEEAGSGPCRELREVRESPNRPLLMPVTLRIDRRSRRVRQVVGLGAGAGFAALQVRLWSAASNFRPGR